MLSVTPLAASGQVCEAPRRCTDAPRWVPGGSGPAAPSPEKVLLLSAVVPGAGQYVQGQRRWVAYLAAEAIGWLLVIDRRRDGGRLRDHYRELAWTVARAGVSEGPRSDGDFDYYEDLSHWERSGSYDRRRDLEGLQPEEDPGTFNGSVWGLARDLFFPPDGPEPGPGDPRYEQALEYYRTRAYAPRYLWDWSGDPSAWGRYGATIGESDDRFRQATLFTGAVVANHLLSAVDAFVSARLSQAAGHGLDLGTRLAAGPGGDWSRARLDLTLSLRPGTP